VSRASLALPPLSSAQHTFLRYTGVVQEASLGLWATGTAGGLVEDAILLAVGCLPPGVGCSGVSVNG
jgi:hypothetical protein